MFLLWHPSLTAINLSYTFPILETSATALCGTTGIYIRILIYILMFILYRVLVSIRCWFLRLSPLDHFGFRFVCDISRSTFCPMWQAISWYLFALQSEEYASRGCTFARFLEICFLANFFTAWVSGERWCSTWISAWTKGLQPLPSLKTNSLQLKMDGWKISFLFWYGFLARYGFLASAMLVSESVYDSITRLTDGWCTSWPSQSF